MIKFSKTATIAVAFVTLASATIYTDPGFAFGIAEDATALQADSITINPALLSADLAAASLASKPDQAGYRNDRSGKWRYHFHTGHWR